MSENVQLLVQYLNEGSGVIIDGDVGSGKSFLVNQVKNALSNFRFIDILSQVKDDADFFKELLRLASKAREHTVFVLDPMDNVEYSDWSRFQTVVETGAQFIVVTRESWKIPAQISKKFKKISCRSTPKVVKTNLSIASEVSPDYRSTLLSIENGSELLDSTGIFDRVREVFEGKRFDISQDELPWLFDNISAIYSGKKLLDAIDAIRLYSCDMPSLSCFPAVQLRFGMIHYPYYYRLRSREKKDDDEEDDDDSE
jgi:hypothetical protein